MRRKRTLGNRVRIALLGFCLLVCVTLDCLFVYLLAVRWAPWREMLGLVSIASTLTGTTWHLFRRRLSISGSDKFFS